MIKNILSTPKHEEDKELYLYNPYYVDVIFPAGPTYLTIAKSPFGNSIVQMFRKTSSKGLSPLEVYYILFIP